MIIGIVQDQINGGDVSSPNAVVNRPVVTPEMHPLRKGPAPGIKSRNAPNTERPRSVPPTPASVELTSVVKKAVSMRRPKVAVMLASIEI